MTGHDTTFVGYYVMAGKRQHYVPQFLQRGFQSRSERGQEFTHLYRKGSDPFETNIRNVGVEGYFYSTKDNDADFSVTSAEEEFSYLVTELREGRVSKFDPQLIARLIAHLEARSRHLRNLFLQNSEHLINEFLKKASDPVILEPFLRNVLVSDPNFLRKMCSDELKKVNSQQSLLPVVIKQVEPILDKLLPVIAVHLAYAVSEMRVRAPEILKNSAKSGHVKALEKDIAPAVKSERLSVLSYRVHSFSSASLLLGDSMVLFHVNGERQFKTFLEARDKLLAVILPLSANAVLVGSKEEYTLELDLARSEIARSALDFFIGHEDSKENRYLASKIGDNAHLLSNTKMEKMIRSFLI